MTAAADLWVDYPMPRPAPARLFCVPYAGAGPTVFRHWPAARPDLEIGVVRLPGRDRRIAEDPIPRLDLLVPALADAVTGHLDRPYALFGHSIGARIAFELARELRRRGAPAPAVLVASGSRPPHRRRTTTLHDLSDDALGDWLVGLGGAPARLLADPELRATVLRVLRADLRLEIDVPYLPEPPLACPIRAIGGDADPEAPGHLLAEWSGHTGAGFTARIVPGGHFFLRQHYATILADIAADLRIAADACA